MDTGRVEGSCFLNYITHSKNDLVLKNDFYLVLLEYLNCSLLHVFCICIRFPNLRLLLIHSSGFTKNASYPNWVLENCILSRESSISSLFDCDPWDTFSSALIWGNLFGRPELKDRIDILISSMLFGELQAPFMYLMILPLMLLLLLPTILDSNLVKDA